MFNIAISLGIFSYIIFALGILGLLYKPLIIFVTILYTLLNFLLIHKSINKKTIDLRFSVKSFLTKEKLFLLFISLILIQIIINLIGALGPELAFDALWYHLTLPKMYLLNHTIYHIPGRILFYSDMPKLGELLYTTALSFSDEILVKLLHLSFGIFNCYLIYKLSRKYFTPLISIIAVVIFYSNLVIAWESITAYIDLIRTFFELLALIAFIEWREKMTNNKLLIVSAVMMGFAISTKMLAIGSLVIYFVLLGYIYLYEKKDSKQFFKASLFFVLISLLIPSPWFVFSFIHTGNPIYPIFSNMVIVTPIKSLFNPIQITIDVWNLFTHSPDPLSPLYIILLPLIIILFPKFNKNIKLISLYSLIALIVWYLIPQMGGGRFIIPYLPAFSLLCAAVINEFKINKKYIGSYFYSFLIFIVLITSVSTILYRAAANGKYIPVIFGKETKHKFLTNHLNFSFGDFYDTDNYFKNHISKKDKVLLIGFYKLYYIEFPFIDESWLRKEDKFNYIAVQNSTLPVKYKNWVPLYQNTKTHVKLYTRFNKK